MLSLTKSKKTDLAYLTALLAAIEPKIYRAFMQSLRSLRSDEVVSKIVAFLNQGQFNSAFDLIERTINNFASDTVFLYTIAGNATAKELTGLLNVTVNFNMTNDRAVRMMQNAHLRLVRDMSNDQRQSVRAILTSGITRGINPKQQAKELTSLIGLSAKQIESVDNYRRLLNQNSSEIFNRTLRDRRFDPTVENARNTGIALTTEQIDRMVDRYAERQLDYRARIIARTEALRVVHQGNEEMFSQAIEGGTLEAAQVKQEWVTATDERVRGSHASMHGQTRPFGQPFISGDGNSLRYPGDIAARASEVINCRCVVVTTLK